MFSNCFVYNSSNIEKSSCGFFEKSNCVFKVRFELPPSKRGFVGLCIFIHRRRVLYPPPGKNREGNRGSRNRNNNLPLVENILYPPGQSRAKEGEGWGTVNIGI